MSTPGPYGGGATPPTRRPPSVLLRPGPRRERGATAGQAVLLVLVLAVFGAAVDALTGRGLREVFAVCLVGGSVLAALRVRRSGLRAVVATPPLVYAGLVLVGGLLSAGGVGQRLADLFTQLVLGAPVLVGATLAALLVAVLRAAALRASRRAA